MNNGIEGMNDNDRLNGSIQSLSNLRKEVPPLRIAPFEIVSLIKSAGIGYENNGDRIILTRGGNIIINGVTYKKLKDSSQKGPVYQISRDKGGRDYIRLRDREKSDGIGIIYGKYDEGGEYIFCGKVDECGTTLKGDAYRINLSEGNLYRVEQSKCDLYSGNFENDATMDGIVKYKIIEGGTMKNSGYDRYEGHIINYNKKEGKGKLTYANGEVYDGNFVNNKFEGMGKYYLNNGDLRYDGYYINDKNLREISDEILGGTYNADEVEKLHEILAKEGGEITGTLYHKEDDSEFTYSITSGTLKEVSNNADFITMFGSKEDEDWSKERGNVVFRTERNDNNKKYHLSSWGNTTDRTFSGGYYDFGGGLKVRKNEYGDKLAKHIANLINFFKDYMKNERIKLFTNRDNAVYKGEHEVICSGIDQIETDDIVCCTKLLGNVSTHFGGITAEKLADWLNKNIKNGNY